MFLMGLGGLLALCGGLYRGRASLWRGPLLGAASPRAGAGHLEAATAQRAIPGARNELARHSPFGPRCNSVGVGGQFLASTWTAAPKGRPIISGCRCGGF